VETGLLVALGFAAIVIVLAIAVTRLIGRGRDPGDRNGRDGDAAAMWEGVRRARDHDE
jgi:hypothetical protein